MSRISKKPEDLVQLLTQAAAAILGEPNWPATAPTSVSTGTIATETQDLLEQLAVVLAQAAVLREQIAAKVEIAYERMQKIDQVTSFLYGPGGAQKTAFGCPPIQTGTGEPGSPGGGSPPPLARVVIEKITDGTPPKSIFVDWAAIIGASYQIEWFTDSALTQAVGNSVATQSKFTITGLVAGTQYWIRVRAVRGGEYGQWSDPATRVANP